MLDFNAEFYQEYNKFLLEYSFKGYQIDKQSMTRLSVFLYGISEEWGEFQGILKRVERGDEGFNIESSDVLMDLILELGDLVAYLVLLLDTLSLRLSDIDGTAKIQRVKILIESLNFKALKFNVGDISEDRCQYQGHDLQTKFRILSRKISVQIGKINAVYERIEDEIILLKIGLDNSLQTNVFLNPLKLTHLPNYDLYINELKQVIANLFCLISMMAESCLNSNFKEVVLLNQDKLMKREKEGKQKGSGSYR